MITLSITAYVVISLYFAHKATKDTYTWTGLFIKGKKTKNALIEGFLTLPAFMLFITIAVACTWLIMKGIQGLGWAIVWIYHNMP